MARMIKTDDQAPVEVKIGAESRWICMCGLSKKRPFCDGSHKQCAGEEAGKMYRYDNGKRTEVAS